MNLNRKQFKFYTRNGKKFLRNYRREVKDGLSALDLQKLQNKYLTEMMINLMPNVYTEQSA